MGHAHGFYLKGLESLESHSEISSSSLTKDLQQHLKALRIRTGEHVNFLSGKGHKFQYECISAKPFQFRLIEKLEFLRRTPSTHLLLALPKKDSLSSSLTQSTEMGVQKITLLRSAHSDPSSKSEDKIIPRANRIIESTLEQCQAPFLPELAPNILPLNESLNLCDTILWADENLSSEGFYGIQQEKIVPIKSANSLGILIGPEGGWSQEEIEFLKKSEKVQALALGPQILKVPTACVASLYQAHLITGAPWEKSHK